MPKAPKTPPTKVTAEMIDKAANTSTVRDLVALADALNRATIHGPYAVELPVFAPCHVHDKGYRQHNVPSGVQVTPAGVSIGKRGHLIFRLDVAEEWICDKGPVQWIELAWDDIVNSFDGLADRIEGYLDGLTVKAIDELCFDAIKRNPAMHKVLNEGMAVASQRSRETVKKDELEQNPLWGKF